MSDSNRMFIMSWTADAMKGKSLKSRIELTAHIAAFKPYFQI